MVEQQLRQRGIHNERVLAAMAKVPRHEFLSPRHLPEAYADHPIVIAEQQTTSQPYMIAAMLQAAEIAPTNRLLEVGTGSGYQTALLAELAAQVFSLERIASLVGGARLVLNRLGYRNITIIAGDGSSGFPLVAPYDAIIVSAAAPRIPTSLIDELTTGGRLIVPVGNADEQVLMLVRKLPEGVSTRPLEGCRFVPLIGREGFHVE
jgi:protein-L-isoaspartate(D-aspartate) O-methyltransferase